MSGSVTCSSESFLHPAAERGETAMQRAEARARAFGEKEHHSPNARDVWACGGRLRSQG